MMSVICKHKPCAALGLIETTLVTGALNSECRPAFYFTGFFEFLSPHFGVSEAAQQLLQGGAKREFATVKWVVNHYKWIVWKLASYERRFPAVCQGRVLTHSAIMQQLQYRQVGGKSD